VPTLKIGTPKTPEISMLPKETYFSILTTIRYFNHPGKLGKAK
jgi:hypothetical protein